jgi:hypothetical protein
MAFQRKAKKPDKPEGPQLDPQKIYRLAELFTPKPVKIRFEQWIIGTSPLICHAFPQKAKIDILAKQTKASAPKDARQPVQDYENSLYHMDNGAYGFPATGIKAAICASAHADKGLAKTGPEGVMANLWLHGAWVNLPTALPGAVCTLPLVRIWGEEPVIREDPVRLRGVTSLGYRGQFTRWAIRLVGHFNPKVISPAALMSLIQDGGEGFGLGDWRTEKRGQFGCFRLGSASEMEAWERFSKGEGPIPDDEDDDMLEAAE